MGCPWGTQTLAAARCAPKTHSEPLRTEGWTEGETVRSSCSSSSQKLQPPTAWGDKCSLLPYNPPSPWPLGANGKVDPTKGPKRLGSAVLRPQAGSCPSDPRSTELQARMRITRAVISSGIYAAKGLCKGEGSIIKETSREWPRLRWIPLQFLPGKGTPAFSRAIIKCHCIWYKSRRQMYHHWQTGGSYWKHKHSPAERARWQAVLCGHWMKDAVRHRLCPSVPASQDQLTTLTSQELSCI